MTESLDVQCFHVSEQHELHTDYGGDDQTDKELHDKVRLTLEMVPHGFWAPCKIRSQSAVCTVKDSPVLKLHLYIFACPTIIFFLLFILSLKEPLH